MSSLAVNFLGIPMASPLIGASGTVGFGLELAKFIDMKEIGAISGKGLAPTHGLAITVPASRKPPPAC